MSYTEKYIAELKRLLDKIADTQSENIRRTAELIVDTTLNGKNIYVFGTTHAGIIAQEAFYRTGGLVVINPILPPGLTCDVTPITNTSKLERVTEYGRIILEGEGIGEGDLLIIHSVSGRNGVPVEMAIAAKEKGAVTVAITNIEYSSAQSSRHPSGKRLYEVCDIVIDNCGCFGDAAVEVDGFAGKVSPTSTVTGAAVINSIVAEATAIFIERGTEAPVFMSANIDGGDEYNDRVMKRFGGQIKYM